MTNIIIKKAFDNVSKELLKATWFLQGYLIENSNEAFWTRELEFYKGIDISTNQKLKVEISEDLFPNYVSRKVEGLSYPKVIWLLRLLNLIEKHASYLPVISNNLLKALDEAKIVLYDYTEPIEVEYDYDPDPDHELGD